MSTSLRIPPWVVSGPGSLARLPEVAQPLGRNVLLVTGRTFARRTGLTDRIRSLLTPAGCTVTCFEDVGPEPDLDTCDAARSTLTEHHSDLVIALGGGSVLDVGKVAAGLANESRPSIDFWNAAQLQPPGVPFIAVPTTSGSGSEATSNGVITNPAVPTKRSIRDNSFLARVVIIDPELTLDCPPEITAHAGLDALCQAIESFTSRHATPLTDTFALRAVSLLADGLPTAFEHPHDTLARTSTALGAFLAGVSMANARAGLVHGLAHPLGARFNISHGRLCGILLPLVMEINRPHVPDKFHQLDELLRGDADAFVRSLLTRFSIPLTLAGRSLSPDDLAPIIEDTLQSGSTKANPGTVVLDDDQPLNRLFS